MFIIIWEYQVKTGELEKFTEIYSSNGEWAELFKKGTGYLGTELLHDEKHRQRHLTIDRWASCESLTEQESLLGKWNSV